MAQSTFAEVMFGQHRKLTRVERFLAELNCVVPSAELTAARGRPSGGRGRRCGDRRSCPPTGTAP